MSFHIHSESNVLVNTPAMIINEFYRTSVNGE